MFRSTNETMNVWTHLLGALLFIFLIYLTYAIPIENMQTMRQDVAKTNAAVLCAGSPEFMSTLFDEEHSKAACVERGVSMETAVAEALGGWIGADHQ